MMCRKNQPEFTPPRMTQSLVDSVDLRQRTRKTHSGRELSGAIAWHLSTNVSDFWVISGLNQINWLQKPLENNFILQCAKYRLSAFGGQSAWEPVQSCSHGVNCKPKGLSSAFALDQLNCPMTIGLEKKNWSLAGILLKCNENLAIFKTKSMPSSSPNHHRNRSTLPSQITFVQTISSRSACRLNEPLTSGEGHYWCAQQNQVVNSQLWHLDTGYQLWIICSNLFYF